MENIVGWTRFVVGIGSFSIIVMGALLFVAAAMEILVRLIGIPRLGLGSQKTTKELVVAAVEHTDTVLIGAALIITGIGLYELFIGQIPRLPNWLVMSSVDELKDKLVGVVITILTVNFFTRVIGWDGNSNILHLGAAIGLVIGSLAVYGILQ